MVIIVIASFYQYLLPVVIHIFAISRAVDNDNVARLKIFGSQSNLTMSGFVLISEITNTSMRFFACKEVNEIVSLNNTKPAIGEI